MNLKISFHLLLVFLISFLVFQTTTSNDDIEHEVKFEFEHIELKTRGLGTLKGLKVNSGFGSRKIYKFLNLPYGKAPIGDLRFRAPVPYDYTDDLKSGEVRDASLHGYHCPQIGWVSGDTEGYEDCLTINVHTPDISKSDELLPVIVWIHGGAFQYEAGEFYNPDYILEQPGVLFVNFNFRLGILGFLSTEDSIIPGNMGLKDQVLALKWVQKYIHEFNGDPKQVTIMGGASGGASVHYHMISKMSRGLFQRAVSQSGVALNPWALIKSPEPKNRVLDIATILNCSTEYLANENPGANFDMEDVVQCLRKVDYKLLTLAQNSLMEWYMDPWVPLGPVIEKDSGDEESFLTDSPYRLIIKGEFAKDIPWIVGVNSQEGLLHAADIVNNEELSKSLDDEWEVIAPLTLNYRSTSLDHYSISSAVRNFYFNRNGIIGKTGKENLEGITQMYSDRLFNWGLHHTAKLHLQYGAAAPIYLYFFNYRGEHSIVEKLQYDDMDYGICHYDQYQYMFLSPYFKYMKKGAKDENFARNFVEIFTNFTKYGVESMRNWRPVSKKDEKLVYNVIGLKMSQIEEPFTKGVDFWSNLGLLELKNEIGFFQDQIEEIERQANKSQKDEL